MIRAEQAHFIALHALQRGDCCAEPPLPQPQHAKRVPRDNGVGVAWPDARIESGDGCGDEPVSFLQARRVLVHQDVGKRDLGPGKTQGIAAAARVKIDRTVIVRERGVVVIPGQLHVAPPPLGPAADRQFRGKTLGKGRVDGGVVGLRPLEIAQRDQRIGQCDARLEGRQTGRRKQAQGVFQFGAATGEQTEIEVNVADRAHQPAPDLRPAGVLGRQPTCATLENLQRSDVPRILGGGVRDLKNLHEKIDGLREGGCFALSDLALRLRLVALYQREQRKSRRQHHAGHRCYGDRGKTPLAPRGFTLHEVVEPHLQHGGRELEQRAAAAIALAPHVRGQRLERRLRIEFTAGIHVEQAGPREGVLRIAGGAADQHAQHESIAAHTLEIRHLLVDPARARRRR